MFVSPQGFGPKSIVITLIGFMLLTFTQAWADDSTASQTSGGNLAQLSMAQLGDLEVTTASKEPEQVWRTPAAIYVLTQEDIRRSGATSIPEALRLVPGVEVARIDSDHWAIGVRGFGSQFSQSLLVLIDGRSVYTSLFAGVYWDVQDTLIEDIDRIEVIRGPGGTIWGANAVNGVINIITKNTKDTRGILASAGGGSVDQGIGDVRYGGGNGNFDYRIYGKALTRGTEVHSDGAQYDGMRMQQGGFRMDWNQFSGGILTLQGDLYHGDDGERTYVGSFSPPSLVALAGNDQVSGGNFLGRWRRDFAGGSDVQIQAYYDRTNRYAPQYGETRDTFDVDFLHHLKLGRRQDFLWGLGIRVSPSDFIQTVPTLSFAPSRQTDSIYSGFLQDEIQIVPRKLSLTIGSKIEHNNYTGFEFEPSVRALWTQSPRRTFWAAVTRAVRTPSRLDTEIALTDFLGYSATHVPIYLRIAGDPSFASEELLGYEAGYRSLIASRLYVDFSAFHNAYENLSSYGLASVSVPTSPITYLLLTEPYANGIKGTTDGFEVAPDWKPTNWWQLKGSYSYLHLNLEDKPGFTDTGTVALDQGSSPHHEVVVQSLFNLPKRFEFDLTYRYVSALTEQKAAAYSTGDVRFGWHATGNVEFSVVGQNLFQPDHGEFGSSPGPLVEIKRSVYAKITWVRETR